MALNNVVIMGRLTKDVELRKAGDHKVTNFTVAVDRNFVDEDGERQADFIRCVAWNGTAEFIEKYFHKGSMIAVTGWIQTGSYEDEDGKTVFTTDIVVNTVSFTGERADRDEEEDEEEEEERPRKRSRSKSSSKKKKTSRYAGGVPF
jgi:single-strand DNA-binding protein